MKPEECQVTHDVEGTCWWQAGMPRVFLFEFSVVTVTWT
jgi:hypothetical protein